ncbi:MAG: ABC transporter permease [Calditrichaeota bacterium]|nr:ABC transporter permease [Calditrichota bacterium]
MYIALAVILFGHGFAHLVGFVVPWRIATLEEMPYKTTVLADSVNVGDLGIRVMGILWLITALAFAVSGIGVLARLTWWLPVTVIVAVFSFFLCIIGWPDSRIGVFINVAIVAFLLVGRQMGWLS